MYFPWDTDRKELHENWISNFPACVPAAYMFGFTYWWREAKREGVAGRLPRKARSRFVCLVAPIVFVHCLAWVLALGYASIHSTLITDLFWKNVRIVYMKMYSFFVVFDQNSASFNCFDEWGTRLTLTYSCERLHRRPGLVHDQS